MIWNLIGTIGGKVLDIVDDVVEDKDEANKLKFQIQRQLIETKSSDLDDLIGLMPAHVVSQDIDFGHLRQLNWTVPFGEGPIGVSYRSEENLSPAGRAFMEAVHQAADLIQISDIQ